MKRLTLIVLGLAGVGALPLNAQSLASRIGDVRNGTVRFAYTSRPDVCGDGRNSIRTGDGNHYMNDGDGDRWPCEYGPVRLSLTISDGAVTRTRVSVGSRWRDTSSGAVDLGRVSVQEAAAYLLQLAQTSRTRAGGEAIFALTLADSVTPWPDMLRLARNQTVRQDTRKQAVFWLGQAAGDAATKDLGDLAEDENEDREVRESAVFALSQLGDDEGVPALIRIAKNNRDPQIRRTALFWLGQSEDPRALDLFEELLANN